MGSGAGNCGRKVRFGFEGEATITSLQLTLLPMRLASVVDTGLDILSFDNMSGLPLNLNLYHSRTKPNAEHFDQVSPISTVTARTARITCHADSSLRSAASEEGRRVHPKRQGRTNGVERESPITCIPRPDEDGH